MQPGSAACRVFGELPPHGRGPERLHMSGNPRNRFFPWIRREEQSNLICVVDELLSLHNNLNLVSSGAARLYTSTRFSRLPGFCWWLK